MTVPKVPLLLVLLLVRLPYLTPKILSGLAPAFQTVCLDRSRSFRVGRRCSGSFHRCRRTLHARGAKGLDLVNALLRFINAHGDELDHRLGDAQAALQLVHHLARAFDRHQDVKPIHELADNVRQPALAHLVNRLYGSLAAGDGSFQVRDQFIQFLFHHVWPDDEHHFISTIHIYSSYSFQDSAASRFALTLHARSSARVPRSPITFFRFFSSLVEDVHRFRYAFFHDHLHCFGRALQHLVCDLKLLLLHRRQNIIGAVCDRVPRPDSHPYADEIWPHGSHHRFDSVVPRARTTFADAHCAPLEVQLVVQHDQVFRRLGFVLFHQLAYREAAQVHEGLWLCQ